MLLGARAKVGIMRVGQVGAGAVREILLNKWGSTGGRYIFQPCEQFVNPPRLGLSQSRGLIGSPLNQL